MSSRSSIKNAQMQHEYVREANEASKTAIEWSTSVIRRTKQTVMVKGLYGCDRVELFRDGVKVYDSDNN